MDTAPIRQLNAAVDHLVVHHGYTSHMRDYEVRIETSAHDDLALLGPSGE
ncbi:YxiG-like protein [Streptomyces sp. NPDC054995]